MALSDLRIKRAKAAEKPYKLYDSLGLFVLVKPNGSKLWRQKYQLDGKERTVAHGSYPAVSLRDARQKRDEIRLQLEAGTDPAVQKRLDQIEAETQARTTFLLVAEEYLEQAYDRELADATLAVLGGDLPPPSGADGLHLVEERHADQGLMDTRVGLAGSLDMDKPSVERVAEDGLKAMQGQWATFLVLETPVSHELNQRSVGVLTDGVALKELPHQGCCLRVWHLRLAATLALHPLHPSRPLPNLRSIFAKLLMKRNYHLSARREIDIYLGYPG